MTAANKLAQRKQLQHAIGLLKAKNLDAASIALQSILQRWPGQGDALHYLGVLRHMAGDSDSAIALI